MWSRLQIFNWHCSTKVAIRQCVNEETWLCPDKTSFTKAGGRPDLSHRAYFAYLEYVNIDGY